MGVKDRECMNVCWLTFSAHRWHLFNFFLRFQIKNNVTPGLLEHESRLLDQQKRIINFLIVESS